MFCAACSRQFLTESPGLAELRSLPTARLAAHSKVNGRTLLDILAEYSSLVEQLQLLASTHHHVTTHNLQLEPPVRVLSTLGDLLTAGGNGGPVGRTCAGVDKESQTSSHTSRAQECQTESVEPCPVRPSPRSCSPPKPAPYFHPNIRVTRGCVRILPRPAAIATPQPAVPAGSKAGKSDRAAALGETPVNENTFQATFSHHVIIQIDFAWFLRCFICFLIKTTFCPAEA